MPNGSIRELDSVSYRPIFYRIAAGSKGRLVRRAEAGQREPLAPGVPAASGPAVIPIRSSRRIQSQGTPAGVGQPGRRPGRVPGQVNHDVTDPGDLEQAVRGCRPQRARPHG